MWNRSRTLCSIGVLSLTALVSDHAHAVSCPAGPLAEYEVATLVPAVDGPLSGVNITFGDVDLTEPVALLRVENAEGIGLSVVLEQVGGAP